MQGLRSVGMQIFSFILTDLTEFEGEPIKIGFETEDEALEYGARMAKQALVQMPDLVGKGMCVTILDEQDETISVVPLDTVS